MPAPANKIQLPSNTTYRIVPSQQVTQGTPSPVNYTTAGIRHIVLRANVLPPPQRLLHPAPLPPAPFYVLNPALPGCLPPPPKPFLKISKVKNGIVLSWNFTQSMAQHASVSTFQIYAYQENPSSTHQPVSSNLWKKVGDVKALPLPMACTLTQFQAGHRYHFAVRAQDVNNRIGPFSDAQTISLV